MNNSENHWLAAKTGATGPTPIASRSHAHRKPAWVFVAPVLMLIILALVFAYAFRDRLMSGVPVEVVAAIGMPNAAEGVSQRPPTEGPATLLFQATGWIEPDPLPIRVTSLYSGVTRIVHVLEGQTVTNGQPIVTLVDDDALLAVRRASAGLAKARAMQSSLAAELKLAEARRLTAQRQSESERAKLAAEVDRVERLRQLRAGTVAEWERVQAELTRDSQVAAMAAAAAVVDEWSAEADRIAKQIEVQKQSIAVAQVALEEADLARSRTLVRSPVDGVVLRLLAAPGKRLMLQMDGPESSTAAILFEPDKLQARVDVPLADAGGLSVGQMVRVSCSLLPDKKFAGTVTRIVGEADLQRNTLQAKVRIDDPDPRLRPEMLCRAEFYGASNGASTAAGGDGQPLAVFVSAAAVWDRDGDRAKVWRTSLDDRRAELREIAIGPVERDGHVRVLDGLRPGDRVIINPSSQLENGTRIRVLENVPHPR